MTSIESNIKSIMDRVGKAAIKSGRQLNDITVIAVTKTVDADSVLEAIRCGINHAGENRVQEFLKKYDIIDRKCKWHLIGHLQTNKVKYIIDKVDLIHSVDSLELAMEIDKRAGKMGRTMDVLLQVNAAGEETKQGIEPDKVLSTAKCISKLANIRVKGLMNIAPYAENPDEIRWVFKEMKKIFIDIKKENVDNIDMKYLSMGMSNDFEAAIEEGSNIVRIGTALFGKRQY